MRNLLILTLLYTQLLTPAYAYLDPGTGSLVISILFGVVATLAYIFKDFFYTCVKRRKKK